jgi:hypothetical protein
MGRRPVRIHPQPSELAAQAWLQTLPELQGVRITAGWDALTDWDGQEPLVTLDDALSGSGEPMAVANCVQIDVWSPDRARELGKAIWKAAAEVTGIGRQMGPRFMANQGGRVTLDLEFRAGPPAPQC